MSLFINWANKDACLLACLNPPLWTQTLESSVKSRAAVSWQAGVVLPK